MPRTGGGISVALGSKVYPDNGLSVPVPNETESASRLRSTQGFLSSLAMTALGSALELFLAALAAEVERSAFGGHLEGLSHRAQVL